jgi:hypothetical protein
MKSEFMDGNRTKSPFLQPVPLCGASWKVTLLDTHDTALSAPKMFVGAHYHDP